MLPRRRPPVAVTLVVAIALVTASVAGLYAAANRGSKIQPHPAAITRAVTKPTPSTAGNVPAASTTPASVNPIDLERDLDRMRQLDIPASGPGQAVITGEATQQPDLYAAEFVRRLLSQDYRRRREDLLSWVKAESSPVADPLVIGLVPPDLRDRFAVYSVTDTTQGPAPVPTREEWAALAGSGAYTTVKVDRVIEPTAWANAVQVGRVTDPGTTARIVAATVTRHQGTTGRTSAAQFSVALSLDLEGPPTRADWRFVTAVMFTTIPVGGTS